MLALARRVQRVGLRCHVSCLGMVEQDHPELGITDCLCQCHAEPMTAAAKTLDEAMG